MKIRNIIKPVMLALVLMYSCEEEYFPEVVKYQDLLVVDGMIHSGPGPYTVKLSFSAPVDNPQYLPYSGCQVIIEENTGLREVLTETEPGTYMTAEDGIQGQVGKTYTLIIHTPDEKTYHSEPQKLLAPVDIENIQASLEYRESQELNHDLVGYQFYLTTAQATTDSVNFMWDLTETWEYTSDFIIEYVYQGFIEEFSDFDSVYRCWKSDHIPNIYTHSTAGLSQQKIVDFPLNYVTTQTRRLMIRYSLLVDQYVIGKQAYQFWDDLSEQIEEESSLFYSQPYQISGNLKNINDPDEPVLGYFVVAGKSSKRIFVDRPAGEYLYYEQCVPITDLRGLGFTHPSEWPVYLTELGSGELAYASDICFDCTLRGGQLDPPPFWESK